MSAAPLLLHTIFQTAGRTIADSLVAQLDDRELSRFGAALHSVAYCCDAVLANPAVMPPTDFAMGGAVADNVVAGEALLIFSDANPKRGYSAVHVRLCEIEEAIAAGPGRPQPARANALARRIGQDVTDGCRAQRRKEVGDRPELQSDLVQLAALLIDGETLRRLHAITDGVPVLAIIGDTRAVGLTSGRFFKSAMRLPGVWLGTTAPAGRC